MNAHFHLGIIPVTLKATVVVLSSAAACGEEASEQKVKSHFPADSALLKKEVHLAFIFKQTSSCFL